MLEQLIEHMLDAKGVHVCTLSEAAQIWNGKLGVAG
jgi:hypothetical protein